MKVLHLFSDWKWTGPAEPTVSLCEALAKEGLDVTIAYRKTPIDFPERTVEKEVKRRSIPFFEGFRLNRYFSLRDWVFDNRAIRNYVREKGIDIVHTNLSHDHFTALLSLRFSGDRPLLLRTDHKRDGMPAGRFMDWALQRTDGIVTYSERIRKQDVETFAFPAERTCLIPPGVVAYKGPVRDMRPELGIGDNEKVIGVIGRLKPDRGYDVILQAFRLLRDRMDGVKLLVMGRSSQIEKSIMEPIARLGLVNDVVLAGYRIDDYFSVISAFDVFVMMRAGSDGTARALREVMAMGKPAIVSDLGMLPDLVESGSTGFVVKPDPAVLADKMYALVADDDRRRAFGAKAAETAAQLWDFATQAREMIAFYEKLMNLRRRS
jgi:glycosyltransferase involved in cell wall biosynthesis